MNIFISVIYLKFLNLIFTNKLYFEDCCNDNHIFEKAQYSKDDFLAHLSKAQGELLWLLEFEFELGLMSHQHMKVISRRDLSLKSHP